MLPVCQCKLSKVRRFFGSRRKRSRGRFIGPGAPRMILQTTASLRLPMPERFGDFELLALLSADAALESYLAQFAGTATPVVLRRLRPSHLWQPGARDAFLSDAQAAMLLQPPGAARVVAVGEVGHQPYLAQE